MNLTESQVSGIINELQKLNADNVAKIEKIFIEDNNTLMVCRMIKQQFDELLDRPKDYIKSKVHSYKFMEKEDILKYLWDEQLKKNPIANVYHTSKDKIHYLSIECENVSEIINKMRIK